MKKLKKNTGYLLNPMLILVYKNKLIYIYNPQRAFLYKFNKIGEAILLYILKQKAINLNKINEMMVKKYGNKNKNLKKDISNFILRLREEKIIISNK